MIGTTSLSVLSSSSQAVQPSAPAGWCPTCLCSFSPLVIESSGATSYAAGTGATAHEGFQSSRHRVKRCNPPSLHACACWQRPLSVLSSSSQAVQPATIAVDYAVTLHHFQSSRHRVKRCNTTPAPPAFRPQAFQSSRHRVKRCNSGWSRGILTDMYMSFSPLVIESSGATCSAG